MYDSSQLYKADVYRFNCFCHVFLSVAISLAWSHVIFSSFSNCFVTICTHVVIGRPLQRLYCSFAYDIAIFTGVSFGSLIACPNHLNRLIFIKVLHGFTLVISYTFSFVIVFGHLIFITYVRSTLRWNESIEFSLAVVRVHISLLYRKMEAI